ncbi:hypothetical protein acdb102_41570 [Acidothermaceae bacterium B102]|nr:hypothetical protein acdb102_41570 [Acidothermaceae bacterium B102]
MPDPLLLGVDNNAGTDLTILESPLQLNGLSTLGTLAVTGQNPGWDENPSVTVTAGTVGVHPMPQDAIVVSTAGGSGLRIQANDGVEWMDPMPVLPVGLEVDTQGGTSISATTQTGQAIVAGTTDPTATQDAVTVSYAGTSRALYAESTSATNINGTITGVNDGEGIGVWGEHKNPTTAGVGVAGVGGAHGRGGHFVGGAANVRLVPATAATHPTTGHAGDLFVDSSARLWFCQKAASVSTPAVWKQLA